MGSKLLTPDWLKWLRACVKNGGTPLELPKGLTIEALTGQDRRALDAIAACWMLWCMSDDDGRAGALTAVRALLPALQPKCRPFARELIAYAVDWGDRAKLWPLVTNEVTFRAPVAQLRLVAVEKDGETFEVKP